MKQFFFFFALFLFAIPAQAQELEIKIPCPLPKTYMPGDADYVPGVDVNGNPVVPADMGSKPQPIIYPVKIPIELDLVRFMDTEDLPDTAVEGLELDANIAYLELFEDGHIEYNGKDLGDRIVKTCADGSEGEIPSFFQNAEPAADSQASPASSEPVALEKLSPAPAENTGQVAVEPLASEVGPEGGQIDGQYP